MKKHSTARRVLALGLNLTLAGVPALLWADEEPTELPALTVSAGAAGKPAGPRSRRQRRRRLAPGPEPARDSRLGKRGQPCQLRAARPAQHPGHRQQPARRERLGAARLRRLRHLPRLQLEPGQPVVQRHSGAIQQRHASAGRLDRRPRRAGRRSVLLPQRRRCRRRLAGLHQQARRPLRRFHGRPGALRQLRRFGSRLRLQPGPGHRPEPKHFVRLDVSRSGGNGYVDRNSRESWNVAFSCSAT